MVTTFSRAEGGAGHYSNRSVDKFWPDPGSCNIVIQYPHAVRNRGLAETLSTNFPGTLSIIGCLYE